jgi:LPXTG-motif cell wall-anchored protein
MRKHRLLLLAAMFGVVGVAGASPAQAETEHCPDHEGNPGKVNGTNNDLVLPAGTVFCVKGSVFATGIIPSADGVTTLYDYLNSDPDREKKYDVSYFVVYEPPVGEPPVGEPPVGEPPVGEPPVGEAPVGEAPVGEAAGPVPPAQVPPPAAAVAAAPAAAPPAPTALPATGTTSWALALSALAMLAGGLGLRRLSRRTDDSII